VDEAAGLEGKGKALSEGSTGEQPALPSYYREDSSAGAMLVRNADLPEGYRQVINTRTGNIEVVSPEGVFYLQTPDGGLKPKAGGNLAQLVKAEGEIGAKATGGAAGKADDLASTKVKWVDENAGMSSRARDYNDSATGARSNPATQSGQAPALERTMPDGSIRLVKFDGVDGEVLVDRKISVVTTSKSKDQALRQSDVLSQNGLTARWEVPTQAQANRAQKMFDELGIKNISVKVNREPGNQ
ncbi:hypothetical protein, partial [Pseudomonas viridiflava]